MTLLAVAASFMMAAWSSSLFVGPTKPGAQAPPRREVLQGLVGAVVGIGQAFGAKEVWADAYGSKPWALSKYAPKVVEIRDDVEAGNMKALLERESALKALNGYWMFSPEEYGKKNKLVSEMLDAADSDDKTKAKELYTRYMSDNVLQEWMSIKPRKQKNMMNVQDALFTGQSTKGSVQGRGI